MGQLLRHPAFASRRVFRQRPEPILRVQELHTRDAAHDAVHPTKVQPQLRSHAPATEVELHLRLYGAAHRNDTQRHQLCACARLPLPLQQGEQPARQLSRNHLATLYDRPARHHRRQQPAQHQEGKSGTEAIVHPQFPTLLQQLYREAPARTDDIRQLLDDTQQHQRHGDLRRQDRWTNHTARKHQRQLERTRSLHVQYSHRQRWRMEHQHLHHSRLHQRSGISQPRRSHFAEEHHQADSGGRTSIHGLPQQLARSKPQRNTQLQPCTQRAASCQQPGHLAVLLWSQHHSHHALGHELEHRPEPEQPTRIQRQVDEHQRTGVESTALTGLPPWKAPNRNAPVL